MLQLLCASSQQQSAGTGCRVTATTPECLFFLQFRQQGSICILDLQAAGQELSLGYNSKDRQTSGQPDLVEVRSLSDTQAAAPASLSAQASWPAAPVARRPGPAGRTPGHSAAVLQQAPPAAWPPIGGPAAANSGAANPLRQQLLQAMAATQGRAPLALAPAGIPVPGGIPQQPQHIVGRPHGLAAVKTEAMKTEPVKAAKAQARQKQPAGSLIVAGVAEDPDWAAIVGAAFLARRLRKSLQVGLQIDPWCPQCYNSRLLLLVGKMMPMPFIIAS